MENSGTGIQLNPPLQPAATTTAGVVLQQNPQTELYSAAANHHLYGYGDPNYQLYYSQSQNPNPFPDLHYYGNSVAAEQIQPPPPGLDVQPLVVIPPPNYYVSSTGYEAATQMGTGYPSAQTTAGLHHAVASTFYQDPNQGVAAASSGDNLPAFGVTGLQNPTISKRTKTSKKPPKKVKIVQSVWCEVCKVDCNTKNVLDQHKLGKKHKKNLQKLIQLANPEVVSPSPVSGVKPVIGPPENRVEENLSSSQTATNEAAATVDLESKRKKMLEGGAAANSVRTCAICNVVCNSDTVFATHLAGQKHAAKLKKHANATKMAVNT